MDIKDASETLNIYQVFQKKYTASVAAIVINEIVLEFRVNSLSLWKYLYNDINRVCEIRGSNVYVTLSAKQGRENTSAPPMLFHTVPQRRASDTRSLKNG